MKALAQGIGQWDLSSPGYLLNGFHYVIEEFWFLEIL